MEQGDSPGHQGHGGAGIEANRQVASTPPKMQKTPFSAAVYPLPCALRQVRPPILTSTFKASVYNSLSYIVVVRLVHVRS